MHSRTAGPKHDAVVLYAARKNIPEHEATIHRDIAVRLADLLDIPFDGVYDPARHQGKRCYFVPSDTLLNANLQVSLNIHSESDLFGGYATRAFMPTKAITHGLVGAHATRPQGWSEQFSTRVRSATLPGYTVFSTADLMEAAQRLLTGTGTIRLKPVHATGGRGQLVLEAAGDLNTAMEQLDFSALAECGLVVEANLDEVETYSVGQVRVGGLTASYIGTQRLTRDNQGNEVYGGSRLQFVRGDYGALQGLALSDERRRAVELARCYDHAADACYPDFFASRRNYDVAAGTDAAGRRVMGVLEQSWRIGGASRAEIAALEVLRADAGCQCLWAETLELFGETEQAPDDAIETFSGDDPDHGRIRKYIRVEADGNKQ